MAWPGLPHVPEYLDIPEKVKDVSPCGCSADEHWCGEDLAIALVMSTGCTDDEFSIWCKLHTVELIEKEQ